jgi:hypothetical protein
LEFHLDDASADVLFRGVVPPLAQRHPPARLFWPKPWVVWAFMLSAIVTGIISWQHFSGTALFVANVVTATGLALLWIVGRPIFEADR